MNEVIKIGKPYLTSKGDNTRLNADITISGVTKTLYLETDSEYGRYFTTELSDAFVYAFLKYSLIHGADIVLEGPISERFHDQVIKQFLSWYYRANRGKTVDGPKPFKIIAEIVDEAKLDLQPRGEVVGTGVSCGVDSMQVFATREDVTHGFVWNMHAGNYLADAEVRRRTWGQLVDRARQFCDHIGKPLIAIDTNYDTNLFPGLKSDYNFTYGGLFVINAFRGLLKKYYFASSDLITDFSMTHSVHGFDCDYEAMLVPLTSTSEMSVQVIGADKNRLEKIKDLISYEPAKTFLNVCWKHTDDGRNCTGHCQKCIRTVLELDLLGVLDDFDKVFDVEYYRMKRNIFLKRMIRNRHVFEDFRDIYNVVKKDLPFTLKLRALFT